MALAGLLVAALVLPATFLIPDQYRSLAVLRAKAGDPGQAIRTVVNDRAYLQSLIAQFGLYPKEAARARADAAGPVSEGHRRSHRQRLHGEFRLSGPLQSAGSAGRGPSAGPGRSNCWTLPACRSAPFTPNRLAMVTAGLFAGFVLGGIALAVRRHRTPTFVTQS